MIYDMQKVLQAFGRLVCGITRKHLWGKPTPLTGTLIADLTPSRIIKTCRRCGLVAPVKTRKRKEEQA